MVTHNITLETLSFIAEHACMAIANEKDYRQALLNIEQQARAAMAKHAAKPKKAKAGVYTSEPCEWNGKPAYLVTSPSGKQFRCSFPVTGKTKRKYCYSHVLLQNDWLPAYMQRA